MMSCFEDLCRLCAGKIDGLLSFNVFAPDQCELLKKIIICLPVHVSERDQYPKQICMDCAFKLDMVFEFRERCLLTAQLFEEMLISTDDVECVVTLQDSVTNIHSTLSPPKSIPESPQTHSEKTEEFDIVSNGVEQIVPTCINSVDTRILQGIETFDKTGNSSGCPSNVEYEVKGEPKSRSADRRKAENGDQKQKCSECGKVCPSRYKLLEHKKCHTGEKPFCCSFTDCGKSFRSKIGLAQHEASHTGQYDLSCTICGKGFQCKSYLKVHQRVHSDVKPYDCHQCSRSFKTKQALLDHTNRHLGVKPYLCDICGRGFITKGLCKSHQKTHTGQDNRQYPCQVCRKLFVSKSYLRIHFNIHTGEKPFMCEVCGKGFLTRVDLKIHATMHTGEKRYVCETCGKAFARRDALRCHRRSHTGERPYKCEYCGQSFSQFTPMAIHKRLHTGERPYPCDDCTSAFVSRSTLLAHRKKNHAAASSLEPELLIKEES